MSMAHRIPRQWEGGLGSSDDAGQATLKITVTGR